MKSRCRAFSLVELLVVVAILGIVIAILLPYMTKVRETSRRVECAANLLAINDALHAYANANNHFYPSVIHDKSRPGYTAYTGADSPDPFAKDSTVDPNDVTASLWLLVRGGYVPAKRFICPSTRDVPGFQGSGPEKRSNFASGKNLSYSYSSPFSNSPDYKLDDTQVADFAVMADKNPGVNPPDSDVVQPAYDASPFELAKANSKNHKRAGQNVLYADGHVAFQSTPYCGNGLGDRRDNVFTARAPVPQAADRMPPAESNGFFGRDLSPAGATDSYLVPADDD
jgi:prepilin-type N-terminal cleavage/methylation domain-containing protein/prepilin-type processing-associated H-X9-DG protein